MNVESVLKSWETPALEKIKIAETRADCSGGNTAGSFKHKAGPEANPTLNCGQDGS